MAKRPSCPKCRSVYGGRSWSAENSVTGNALADHLIDYHAQELTTASHAEQVRAALEEAARLGGGSSHG